MANFGKFGNLSLHGWDSKTSTQSITVGQSAHIGLWGGGPGGVDLDVDCLDESVCICHEEPKPKQAGWRHFLLTGLQPGTTDLQALLGSNVWASAKVHVTGKSGVKLVFFPGEHLNGSRLLGTIYVIGGKGEAIPAAGGPSVGGKNPMDGGHTFEPTPAGHYTLGPKQHVIAPSWTTSAIPWGAKLRINKGEVEYQDDSGKGGWIQVTGSKGVLTLAHLHFQQKNKKKITLLEADTAVRNALIDSSTGALRITTWELNDFGRWGWNLRLKGQHTGYYVHTTPKDEQSTAAGQVVLLANSHGCIHIRPADRDDFISKGYLKEGVDFEVRPYSETGPP